MTDPLRAPDPEVADALRRRGIIFTLLQTLREGGAVVSVQAIEAAMCQQPQGTFKPADFLWVQTTLAKRLG